MFVNCTAPENLYSVATGVFSFLGFEPSIKNVTCYLPQNECSEHYKNEGVRWDVGKTRAQGAGTDGGRKWEMWAEPEQLERNGCLQTLGEAEWR